MPERNMGHILSEARARKRAERKAMEARDRIRAEHATDDELGERILEPWERPAQPAPVVDPKGRYCPGCKQRLPDEMFTSPNRAVCGPCAAPIPMRLPPQPKHLRPVGVEVGGRTITGGR